MAGSKPVAPRVIAGLVPAISTGRAQCTDNQDGRDKPGHDRHEPPRDEIYPIGLRFHTPIISGQSAEYCRPLLSVCSMSRKTLCIRAWVVTPSSIALGKR